MIVRRKKNRIKILVLLKKDSKLQFCIPIHFLVLYLLLLLVEVIATKPSGDQAHHVGHTTGSLGTGAAPIIIS